MNAKYPPKIGPIIYIHILFMSFPFPDITSKIAGPNATAGLKAPPEIPPTQYAEAITVNPIAKP